MALLQYVKNASRVTYSWAVVIIRQIGMQPQCLWGVGQITRVYFGLDGEIIPEMQWNSTLFYSKHKNMHECLHVWN